MSEWHATFDGEQTTASKTYTPFFSIFFGHQLEIMSSAECYNAEHLCQVARKENLSEYTEYERKLLIN